MRLRDGVPKHIKMFKPAACMWSYIATGAKFAYKECKTEMGLAGILEGSRYMKDYMHLWWCTATTFGAITNRKLVQINVRWQAASMSFTCYYSKLNPFYRVLFQPLATSNPCLQPSSILLFQKKVNTLNIPTDIFFKTFSLCIKNLPVKCLRQFSRQHQLNILAVTYSIMEQYVLANVYIRRNINCTETRHFHLWAFPSLSMYKEKMRSKPYSVFHSALSSEVLCVA